jgi:hypothetical protein
VIDVNFYQPADMVCWNMFNDRARNGHLLFDRGFMGYHADRFEDASLVFRRGDAVVGLLPANRREGQIYSHQGLTFGGLIVAEAQCLDVMAMLDRAVDHWRDAGATALRYKPLPHFYHHRPAQDDLYWLTRAGAVLVRRDVSTTIALDARVPPSSRRRRGATKAAKAGLAFVRSARWMEFWEVLNAVLGERHGTGPVHALSEIQQLAARFPDAIRLYAAERGGSVLAGVVIFASGGVWHTQYIAAGEEARSVGALDGLFPHVIDQAAQAGARFFDFGISTEEEGRILNLGLITQKEEFGGSATVYDAYSLTF